MKDVFTKLAQIHKPQEHDVQLAITDDINKLIPICEKNYAEFVKKQNDLKKIISDLKGLETTLDKDMDTLDALVEKLIKSAQELGVDPNKIPAVSDYRNADIEMINVGNTMMQIQNIKI